MSEVSWEFAMNDTHKHYAKIHVFSKELSVTKIMILIH
jgi:hypothetical protein